MLSGGKRKYNGLVDCFRKVVRTEGIRGCYKGMSMALTGVFAYKALSLGTYDFLKTTILADKNIGFWKKYAIANAVTQGTNLALYPLDTVGRTLMIESGSIRGKQNTATKVFKKILRREGIKGFYKGLSSDAMTGLGTSLILVLYDDLKKVVINRKKF
jgi:solute carrier family 25 (adenine nucleotide translocator) protein 4/5/6/31